MYKNINNIFIYLYIYIFRDFNLLYPLKYTKEAAIGQCEELVHQHVFENGLNILQLYVKTQKSGKKMGKERRKQILKSITR